MMDNLLRPAHSQLFASPHERKLSLEIVCYCFYFISCRNLALGIVCYFFFFVNVLLFVVFVMSFNKFDISLKTNYQKYEFEASSERRKANNANNKLLSSSIVYLS